ncbi:MAG: helix-turn-helix domain-containing protein [Treponema sp.]|nr:helix-turn-helix domain-containing protein [Treponema sp.]
MIKKPSGVPKYGGSITIQDWMVRLYFLQGDYLLVYATIHSFSKDGESVFRGSLRYLAFWTGKSKPTVMKVLKYLIDNGLIGKRVIHYTRLNQARHYCEYWTIFSRLEPSEQKKLLSSTK